MEIFVYFLSIVIPMLPCLLIPPLAVPMWLFAVPIAYIFLWVKLIKHKSDSPKALWRFILEWGSLMVYMLFCLVKYGSSAVAFNAYSDVGSFFLMIYFPIAFSSELQMRLILPLSVFMLSMCIFYLLKHYKETGKLW